MEPTFAQPERRSFVVPALLALVVFALAFFVWKRAFFPSTSVDITHLHTDVLPFTTEFKTDTMMLGPNETNSTLLVATTVRIDNHRKIPISLDDFSMTLTDGTGATLTEKAVQRADLPNLESMFPKLKALAGTQLLRDTEIAPGKAAGGTLIFSFPVPMDLWNKRTTATVEAQIYHQPAVQATVPK